MRFKIDWASLILGRKFTAFLCFTLYLRAISKYKPPGGANIWRGDLTEGFLRYEFWGAYIWRDLYMEGLIFFKIMWTTTRKNCVMKKRVARRSLLLPGWHKMTAPSLLNPRPLFCCF